MILLASHLRINEAGGPGMNVVVDAAFSEWNEFRATILCDYGVYSACQRGWHLVATVSVQQLRMRRPLSWIAMPSSQRRWSWLSRGWRVWIALERPRQRTRNWRASFATTWRRVFACGRWRPRDSAITATTGSWMTYRQRRGRAGGSSTGGPCGSCPRRWTSSSFRRRAGPISRSCVMS